METGADPQRELGGRRNVAASAQEAKGPVEMALEYRGTERPFVTLLFGRGPSNLKVGKFTDQQATWMLRKSPGCPQMLKRRVDQQSRVKCM